MKKLKLQNILFPSAEICMLDELYFRSESDSYVWANEELQIKKGREVSFDTYFNSFSIGKWTKYTNIKRVKLTLFFTGRLRITLMRKERIGKLVRDHYIKEKIVETRREEVVLEFEDSYTNGVYTFTLEALEDTDFYGGYYWADLEEDKIQDIRIALNICTYRREEFVRKNMKLFQKRVFSSYEDEEFRKNLGIYIIDNAKTLGNEFDSDNIHVIPNKNAGGAGGFTRGLIEIKNFGKFTHALLMGDDIVVDPESVYRTWALLSIVKEEYRNVFIAGAMLRLDQQHLQVESGALWNSGALFSRKCGLNLREIEACLYNEIEETVDYSAWWYTCLPLSVVNDENLPLPIFIRGDDVEYGLRNARKILTMNGICVWHEPFENKYSSSMFYYILRNRLIDNAIHKREIPKKQFHRLLRQQVMGEVYLYRYKNAQLLLSGVRDYLAGIDWLKEQDGECLNRSVMERGYKMQYAEEAGAYFDYGEYERGLQEEHRISFLHKVIKRLTMNGILLTPQREQVILPVIGTRERSLYRVRRVVNYDVLTQKCFITCRDKTEARECRKLLGEVQRLVEERYETVNKEYQSRGRELMNKQFWDQYLGLDNR